jgi:hypothetical protein
VANIILYQYSGDHHQNNGKDKPQTRNLGQIGMGVKLRGNYDKQAINQPENGCDHNHGDAQWDDNEETGQKVTTNLGSKPLEHAHILIVATTGPRPIILVYQYDLRLVVCQLLFIQQSVGGDNNQITWLAFASSSAVETDFSGSFGPNYGISVKPLPVGEVVHCHLLVLGDIYLNHEAFIDAQTALIVQTRSRNPGPMDFGFQESTLHGLISSVSMKFCLPFQ